MSSAREIYVFDEKELSIIVDELALTPRQAQIVRHLFAGKSDKQMAKEMGLAVATVRTHLGRLFAKFGVQDRTALVIHIFHHFRNGSKLNSSAYQNSASPQMRLSVSDSSEERSEKR